MKQGFKKIATVSQDYTFGHEQCGGLAQVFSEGGGKIVQQFWHPLNTADFSPYLGQIAERGVDAVFAMETGADGDPLHPAIGELRPEGPDPAHGRMNCTDQSVIRTLGEREPEGIVSPAHFAEGSDNPATQKFVKDYEAKYGKMPSLYGFSMYSGAMWIAEAMKKMGGKVEDRDGVPRQRCRKTELTDSPLGTAVQPRRLRQPDLRRLSSARSIKRADGKFWNVPTRDLSERVAVLEIRSRDLHEAAALLAHLPGHQELIATAASRIAAIGAASSDHGCPSVRADPDTDDVVVAFGALRAVDGVSLFVPRGERRAIIGPNGAGKTTLFNAITGVSAADQRHDRRSTATTSRTPAAPRARTSASAAPSRSPTCSPT